MHKKIEELDFARVIAALGVVIAHFSSANQRKFPTAEYANVSLGALSVSCFFIICGFVLFYSYDSIPSLLTYYKKQWWRLFPEFYIVWVVFYLERVFQTGSFLYNGEGTARYFLLSLTGFDGYLAYAYPKVYYITGEWFLGAMIIIRMLFPLLLWMMKKCSFTQVLALGGVLVMYAASFMHPLTEMYRLRTVPYCLLSFMAGWAIQKTGVWKDPRAVFVSLTGLIILIFVKLPSYAVEIYTPAAGICTVVAMLGLGRQVCRVRIMRTLCAAGSRLSYNIFLLQHIIIYKVFSTGSFRGLGRKKLLFLLLFTTAVICLYAWGLEIVAGRIRGALSAKSYRSEGNDKKNTASTG